MAYTQQQREADRLTCKKYLRGWMTGRSAGMSGIEKDSESVSYDEFQAAADRLAA